MAQITDFHNTYCNPVNNIYQWAADQCGTLKVGESIRKIKIETGTSTCLKVIQAFAMLLAALIIVPFALIAGLISKSMNNAANLVRQEQAQYQHREPNEDDRLDAGLHANADVDAGAAADAGAADAEVAADAAGGAGAGVDGAGAGVVEEAVDARVDGAGDAGALDGDDEVGLFAGDDDAVEVHPSADDAAGEVDGDAVLGDSDGSEAGDAGDGVGIHPAADPHVGAA